MREFAVGSALRRIGLRRGLQKLASHPQGPAGACQNVALAAERLLLSPIAGRS